MSDNRINPGNISELISKIKWWKSDDGEQRLITYLQELVEEAVKDTQTSKEIKSNLDVLASELDPTSSVSLQVNSSLQKLHVVLQQKGQDIDRKKNELANRLRVITEMKARLDNLDSPEGKHLIEFLVLEKNLSRLAKENYSKETELKEKLSSINIP